MSTEKSDGGAATDPHRIGWTLVGEHVVSTVDLEASQLRLRFETMVFRQEGGEVSDWGELECVRYATREEAEAGHAATVAKWTERSRAKEGA